MLSTTVIYRTKQQSCRDITHLLTLKCLVAERHIDVMYAAVSASPCLWNQLPFSLRKPHSGTSSSISCSPIPSPITSSSDSPLCTSITPSLFHSQLKTYLFHKSYPLSFSSSSRTASTDFCRTVSSELLGF